jgi:hypothetical protein
MDALPVFDVAELTERTLRHTLEASTVEEVLASPEAQSLDEYADHIVELQGISGCLPSTYDTGSSRYMVLDIVDTGTGERASVTTGGAYAMTRAMQLARLGALPQLVRVLVLESKNNPGRTSTWLVRP